MSGFEPSIALLLAFCVASALAFEFINGFHDTANAVATIIYTHSMKPLPAVIWSGVWNFIGVNIGGIAVAIGIINLLPVEAITDNNLAHNLALVMALIITAIVWNIGTWYLGIPCSSSHTLIGSITGVSIGYILLPNNHDISLNWGKVQDAGLSLLISPVIGFLFALILMVVLKKITRNKALFKEPPAKKAPPFWIRSMLILTSTFVSFSHGSNDGQKGIGLLMIILIAILPSKYALDHSRNPAKLRYETTRLEMLIDQVDAASLNPTQSEFFNEIKANLASMNRILEGKKTFGELPGNSGATIRRNILITAKRSNSLMSTSLRGTDQKWNKEFSRRIQKIKTYTEYSPWWVILMISISLGLGTMIGWRRIVVTLGEKIGKSRLTYAQGAAANLVAASTISVSSFFGLPVSTTHVLSSGIAGTMVSGNGIKNLQGKTLASIGIAWLITIPVTMLFSGLLFLLFRLIL